MPDRVVDASVFAAAYFRERRWSEASRLIAGDGLVAPTLLNYEMANIAGKKLESFPQQQERILESLQTFLRLNVQLRDVDYRQVVDLAALTGLTAYDASYLYVARELSLPLITFDTQLARVARIWGSG